MDDFHSRFTSEWEQLNTEIQKLHSQRNKNDVAAKTKKGIELFLQYLYWCNGLAVNPINQSSISDLEIKPVNLKERLDFILHRPNLYPSYIQLCELMVEMEKLYAKKEMMKKTSSHKND